MGFLSNLFGGKENPKAEIQTAPLPIEAEVAEVAEQPQGFSQAALVENMMGYGDLEAIADKVAQPNLQKEVQSEIMDHVGQVLENRLAIIKTMKTQKEMRQDIFNLCESTATYTLNHQVVTYENFLQTQDGALIERGCLALHKLEANFPSIFNALPDLNQLAEQFKDMNQAYNRGKEQAMALVATSKKLLEDITAYTLSVNEAKVKYRLSVDWNGKKQPLMALGQQLGEKREAFLIEEETLNKDMETLYTSLSPLLEAFAKNYPSILEEMEHTPTHSSGDSAITERKQALRLEHGEILNIKTQLEFYFLTQ